MMDTGFSLAERIPGRKGKHTVWGGDSADEFAVGDNCQAARSK